MKDKMNCYDGSFLEPLPDDIIVKFHSDEYIDLLKNINEHTIEHYRDHKTRFGFGADCPCPSDSKFYDFCYLYTKGWCFENSC